MIGDDCDSWNAFITAVMDPPAIETVSVATERGMVCELDYDDMTTSFAIQSCLQDHKHIVVLPSWLDD